LILILILFLRKATVLLNKAIDSTDRPDLTELYDTYNSSWGFRGLVGIAKV